MKILIEIVMYLWKNIVTVIVFGFGLALLLLNDTPRALYITVSVATSLTMLAILLSWLAQWGFTHVNFIKERDTRALGYIFLGVCIIVAMCAFGVYQTAYR